MSSSTHYVPILKGRHGEYGALQTLSESVWHVRTPVLELPPIPWNFEADRPARSIDTHLKKVGQKIERAWGTNRDIFVDLIWISEAERMANSQHPLDFVFSALRSRNVRARSGYWPSPWRRVPQRVQVDYHPGWTWCLPSHSA